jgi:ferredoxin-NADP reductase
MKFMLSATKQEANDTFSFIFAPEEPLQWKAGQLLRYVLDHPNPDDRGVERFFSNRVSAARRACNVDDAFCVEE